MLASITPLGERGRGSTWVVTVVAFAAGAVAAASLAGAALGSLGGVALTGAVGSDGRLIALGAGLAVAAGFDLLPVRLPGPRRQVDERWLDRFRGWVYGLGFGAQLGLAVTTVVSSAATYAAGWAALLSGSSSGGTLILGIYGLLRGLTPLAAAGVRRPDQLLALHSRLQRWRRPVALSAPALLALIGLCAGAAA